MVIRDNGTGFKADQLKATALGLQLVRTAVKHIEGSLKIDGSRGTRLEIAFREPKRFGIQYTLEDFEQRHYLQVNTCPNPDSNRGHSDLQSDALPTELLGQKWARRDSNA